MALYVIRPPNPPPGQDWLAAVPGQYLYNVTGVYATLDTSGGGTELADSSGNNNNGTYGTDAAFGAFVPGLLAGQNAWQPDAPPVAPSFNLATIPHPLADWNAPFTLAWWQRYDVSELGGGTAQLISFSAGDVAEFQVFGSATNGNPGSQPLSISTAGPNVWIAPAGVLVADGTTHHVAIVWDLATLVLYIDRVLVPWAVSGSGTSSGTAVAAQFGNPDMGAGTFQAYGVFPSALDAATVAALDAAGAGGIAAYTTAALAQSPTAYYLFDGVGGGVGRQVTLSITDSNNEVERIPSGFDPLATPGPYAWSWLPKLNSAAENATSATITVPLPTLLLPAGYTIGTNTLDIDPTDQWSNIAIWWNSDAMDASEVFNPYAYPPGATLVYQQIQGPT